ncbi:DUF580-domain-containing protein [Tilletiaria anomala UBC 951]|uniref:Protein PNS1 n=1 Tax=Tilletiaria anomala (strain ATCC 24038 / CBS 436.72 / UBC 951) TaxID=1037660 RepID=A0A066W8M4_TILAU|nr:DUF580-domain-containing protein [Tilletiaria anomala UBC 951]KDN47140.1 DUF580-domain-containing protein [Tilletiaria anomala UBC 951]
MAPPHPYASGAPYAGGNVGGDQAAFYNQTQQAPAGYYNNGGGFSGKDDKMLLAPHGFEGQRCEPKRPKFRDPIFALLVLAVLAGFVAISVISLRAYSTSDVSGSIGGKGGIGSTLNHHTAILLMLSCAVALVLSVLYILLVKLATTIVLEVTLALSVLANVAYAVLLWIRGFTSAAIIFTIFSVISIVSYFFIRKRIPLAKLMLRTIIRASNEYKSTYIVALLGLVVQTAFSVWWAWTLVAVYQRFEPGTSASGSSASSGAVTGLVVFLVFAWYYLSEVIKNIFFTTVAGVYATWYYNETGAKVNRAALSSFKRATTFSLGSIAFGSLIVALLDLLRAVLNVIQQSQAQEGDVIGTIVTCIAECCVSCIDWIVQYFNRYAYINIAMYGNSYIEAAKETWDLLRNKGIDALINDSLVNIVYMIGAYIIATLTALFAYVYLRQTNPSYVQEQGNYFSVILLYAFGLGINIALALGQGSIGSGVSVLFVGLGEDPQLLAHRDPQLFEAIRQAYPDVVRPVA